MSTRPDTVDGGLLAIHVTTLCVLTDSGRILHVNDPDRSVGPRLYLPGSELGNVVRVRHDVGEETARAINALVAEEPPLGDPDSTPLHLDDYVELLASEAPVERCDLGLNWTFPDRLDYKHPVVLVDSESPAGDRLLARLTEQGMPKALTELGFVDIGEFWAPWCIALHGDEIASIAFTARIGPTGAEVGVATIPELRGRGFAAAATAGWASHPSLQRRALFYGTERTNVSSQRVTDRLGLRFIGTSLALT